MIRLLILLSFFLLSCDNRLEKYEKLVGEVNTIVVHYKNSGKTVTLSHHQTETFKGILIRNVNPELQRKFIGNIHIDLFKNDKRIGFLLLTENAQKPFVNFNSDSLNFGFGLTYGIGRFLEEIEHAKR